MNPSIERDRVYLIHSIRQELVVALRTILGDNIMGESWVSVNSTYSVEGLSERYSTPNDEPRRLKDDDMDPGDR